MKCGLINNVPLVAFEKKMLEEQAELMLDVRALKRLVMPGLAQSACVQFTEGCQQLPVSSVANVKELNNFLSRKESLESMVTVIGSNSTHADTCLVVTQIFKFFQIGYWSKFSETEERDATHRVMRSQIGNEIRKQISWRRSREEKAAFCEYKWLQKLLFCKDMIASHKNSYMLSNEI